MHDEPDCVSVKNENTFSPTFSNSREISIATQLATKNILLMPHIIHLCRQLYHARQSANVRVAPRRDRVYRPAFTNAARAATDGTSVVPVALLISLTNFP